MSTWDEVTTAAPELAAAVQARFRAERHAMLATLRRDGSPRLSGIETLFARGQLWLGMMLDSRKALDLRRDPRLALHSASTTETMDDGDTKISGLGVEATDPIAIRDTCPPSVSRRRSSRRRSSICSGWRCRRSPSFGSRGTS